MINITRHEYALKDHLGNARVFVCDNPSQPGTPQVLQESYYYAYGLPISELSRTFAGQGERGNKYQYNGIELIDDFGLNANHALYRTLDPQRGQWWQIDPKAEEYYELSPYNANEANPITNTDPDGDCPKCLKVFGKTILKSIAKGKVDLGEVYDFVDNASTLVGSESTLTERGEALFNMVSPVSTKEAKTVAKTLGVLDDARDAGKATDKVKSEKLVITVADADKIDRKELNPPDKHGNAPTFKKDGTKVEVHHEGQKREGPFKEMHKQEHRGKGNDKVNHPNKKQKSEVDRSEFNKARQAYWKSQFPKQ